MKHRQAVEHLANLRAGESPPDIAPDLASHVKECSECRTWVATYHLLLDGLSADRPDQDDHPDPALLALCVIRPEEIHETGREELCAHLRTCRSCRRDVERTGAAVRSARPREQPWDRTEPEKSPATYDVRRWLAAAVTVLLFGSGLVLGGLVLGRLSPEEGKSGQLPDTKGLAKAPLEEVRELAGIDLDGTQVIGSDRKLVLSKLTVKPGADVTLRAAQGVAFGDGFRVASGARLTVGATAPDPRRPLPPKPGSGESKARDRE